MTPFERMYWDARREHAWLLRAEGLTLKEVGERLDICKQQARNLIHSFGRRMQSAIRRGRMNAERRQWQRLAQYDFSVGISWDY